MSRRYGDSVANSFGLDRAPLLATRSLQLQQIAATHVVCGVKQIGMTPRIPREDTFIAAVSLTDMPLHELWSKGRPFISEGWGANSMRIVNLAGEFAARVFTLMKPSAFTSRARRLMKLPIRPAISASQIYLARPA